MATEVGKGNLKEARAIGDRLVLFASGLCDPIRLLSPSSCSHHSFNVLLASFPSFLSAVFAFFLLSRLSVPFLSFPFPSLSCSRFLSLQAVTPRSYSATHSLLCSTAMHASSRLKPLTRILSKPSGLGLALGVSFVAFRPLLPAFFTADAAVASAVYPLLLYVAVMQPINALVFVGDGVSVPLFFNAACCCPPCFFFFFLLLFMPLAPDPCLNVWLC